MLDSFAELVTVMKGRGVVTLYRAKNAEKAKSFQHHNNLAKFEGKKVSLVETQYNPERLMPMGWVFKATKGGVPHVC